MHITKEKEKENLIKLNKIKNYHYCLRSYERKGEVLLIAR